MRGLPNRLGLMGMFGQARSVRFGGLGSAASDVGERYNYEQGVVPDADLEFAKTYKAPVREATFEPEVITGSNPGPNEPAAEPDGPGFFDKLLKMVGAGGGGSTRPNTNQQYLAQRDSRPPWALIGLGVFALGLVAVAATRKRR